MDTKDLRGLMEAYSEVYAPQENIEEGLRSAVKRLLGGGKKEAEAPKPESRGEQLRKKYNVGPEKSDTSAKRQILNRSRARAERDERDYGSSKYSKSVAQKSKAAHERYLKAGYSKYGADDARGSGNKARKRAASLNREEFEFIVNALIEEGYDLSSYTWDEMYEICLDEAVKGADPELRRAASAERRGGDKRLSPSTGKGYAAHAMQQAAYVDKKTKGKHIPGYAYAEEVEQVDEASSRDEFTRAAIARSSDRKGGITFEPGPNWDPSANRGKGAHLSPKQKEKQRRKALRQEELDIFDAVLEFLQAEGFAETLEEAEWLMANVINEEAIGIILGEDAGIISGLAGLALGAKGATYAAKHSKRLRDYPKNFVKGMVDPRTYVSKKKKEQNEEYVDEAQHARENPEKYEREQAKKSAPVRGERTPMPPRGDKRREDFEKWYRANVR